MREPSMNNIQKDEILKKCFTYFVEHGLERISMRKMCDETGMAMSSAYYWFKDKDEAVLDSAEYGLNVVTDKLFNYVFSHIGWSNKVDGKNSKGIRCSCVFNS